eukprot:2063814-Amphidinium_carterae.1
MDIMGIRHQFSIPMDSRSRYNQSVASIRTWPTIRDFVETSESSIWSQDITKTMAAAPHQHLGQRAQVPSEQV